MVSIMTDIVAVFLSMNILLSSVGITISVHQCNTKNTKDVTIAYLYDNSDDCESCAMEAMPSCCSEETEQCTFDHSKSDDSYYHFEKEECCKEFSKLIKLDYYTTISELSKIIFESYINTSIYNPLSEIKKSFFSGINYKFESGVSPPYASNYIFFIASILQ